MADQEQRHASKQAREVLADLEGKLFATVPEVAVILRSDVRSIRRAIAAGEIPAQPVGPAQARAGPVGPPSRAPGNERGRSLRTGPPNHVHPPRDEVAVLMVGAGSSRRTSSRPDTDNDLGQRPAGADSRSHAPPIRHRCGECCKPAARSCGQQRARVTWPSPG
jgi:hypothetical protein